MLLVIDQKIEGEVRERMLVSYYRYRFVKDFQLNKERNILVGHYNISNILH